MEYCQMITTISLVNICYLMQLVFFLMMTAFKIYSLSNFQIYNTVLLTIVTMLYITSSECIYLITGSLYLLTIFTHFSHHLPPASGSY